MVQIDLAASNQFAAVFSFLQVQILQAIVDLNKQLGLRIDYLFAAVLSLLKCIS